jgi:hypothetical protein
VTVVEEAETDELGHLAVLALIEEARRIVGGAGLPVRMVLLRLRRGRPEDDAARAHLYGPEPVDR